MSSATDPSQGKSFSKSNNYFLLGGVSMLLMGLFSAVDASIVYIFLGLSCYLFFLGFYNRPGTVNRFSQTRSQRQPFTQSKAQPTTRATDFGEQFQKFISIFASSNPKHATNRRALAVFLFIFIGVFIIPILGSIFSSGGSSYSSPYFDIAELQFNAGQYDSALVYYRRAIEEQPEYEEALLGYGRAFSALDQCDSAIVMYDQVLALNADNKYAMYSKAYCYYQQKRYAEGLEITIPLVEKNEDYYEAVLLLGDFYYAQNQNEEALTLYDRAYNDGGMRGFNLCYIMGYLYQDKKDNNKAVALFQEALTYDSTEVDLYKRLGELIPGSDGDFYRTKAAGLK